MNNADHELQAQHISPAQLAAWDRAHVWHAFTQMAEYEPWILHKAEGCTLYDTDGKAYLDGVSSLWCNLHGHRHPKLDAAIVAQLNQVAHVTNLGASNVPAILLARRLAGLAPPGLQHVFFSDDGATAVEVALKMAFQYWRQRPNPRPQKTRYIALENAYHGDTLGSVSVGGVARFHQMFQPLLFAVDRLPCPRRVHLPKDVSPETAAAHFLGQLEQLLADKHDTIAAMIVEPLVQAAAGMILHPAGYLRGVRALTQKYEVLLIADEVAVGFGRTGKMFACEHEQVAPDFLCLAKGLTAGYMPMAATITTAEIFQAFLGSVDQGKTFFHGHTYGGNPLAASVALASLDLFEQDQVLARVSERIHEFTALLEPIAQHRCVGQVRQCGLIAGIELVKDKTSLEPFAAEDRVGYRVCRETTQNGVWLRPLGDVVVVMPPLAISSAELARIVRVLHAAIETISSER